MKENKPQGQRKRVLKAKDFIIERINNVIVNIDLL